MVKLLEKFNLSVQFLHPFLRLDLEHLSPFFSVDIQTGKVEVLKVRHKPERRMVRGDPVAATLNHPNEDPEILAESRPQISSVFIFAKPIDAENFRRRAHAPAHI